MVNVVNNIIVTFCNTLFKTVQMDEMTYVDDKRYDEHDNDQLELWIADW